MPVALFTVRTSSCSVEVALQRSGRASSSESCWLRTRDLRTPAAALPAGAAVDCADGRRTAIVGTAAAPSPVPMDAVDGLAMATTMGVAFGVLTATAGVEAGEGEGEGDD